MRNDFCRSVACHGTNDFPICLAKKSQTLLRIAIMNIRLVVAISYSEITLDNTIQREF